MASFRSDFVAGWLSGLWLVLVGGLPLTAQAANWNLAPGLSIGQTYTDNANLDASKRSESITRISPHISLYREGARSKFDLTYAPQYRKYWQETNDNELVNFLRAEGDMELYRSHFFLNGRASVDQRNTSSRAREGIDSATGIADQTTTYSAALSPYYKTRLGRSLLFEARYDQDRVYYDTRNADSSTGRRLDLVLGSGEAVRVMPWEVRLEQSEISYDRVADDDRIRRAVGQAAYQFDSHWALGLRLGYEKYELASSPDQDGSVWGLGFIYTPNSRTRLAAGLGQRSFGDDYYLQFSHRSRHTVWNASYNQDFVSSRNESTRPTLFDRRDAFGNLIRDPALSSPVNATRSGPTLNSEYYQLNRFTTSFTLATGRTDATLGASYTEREYDRSSLTSDTEDVIVYSTLSRQLRPHTSAFLRVNWSDHNERLLDYEQWLASLGGSYQLGRYTSLVLTLAHLRRDANPDIDSYEENRASLTLDRSW